MHLRQMEVKQRLYLLESIQLLLQLCYNTLGRLSCLHLIFYSACCCCCWRCCCTFCRGILISSINLGSSQRILQLVYLTL